MKPYLVVFFVLCSLIGFGQKKTLNQCYLKFCNPEVNIGYLYRHYNHFQDFFPHEKMQEYSIQSFSIIKEELNVNQTLFTYFFDENGFVNQYTRMENNSQTFYEREYDKITKRKYLNNPTDKDTSILYYFYTQNLIIKSYDFPGHHIGQGVSNLFIDDENRVSQTIYYVRVGENILDSTSTKYNYDKDNLSCSFFVREEQCIVKFNHEGQPIKEQSYKDSLLHLETNFSYNTIGQLIEYSEKTLRPIPIKDNTGNWILPSTNNLSNYIIEKKKVIFHYNANGLLEKIIQTTDEGICEYRVYYYTE